MPNEPPCSKNWMAIPSTHTHAHAHAASNSRRYHTSYSTPSSLAMIIIIIIIIIMTSSTIYEILRISPSITIAPSSTAKQQRSNSDATNSEATAKQQRSKHESNRPANLPPSKPTQQLTFLFSSFHIDRLNMNTSGGTLLQTTDLQMHGAQPQAG